MKHIFILLITALLFACGNDSGNSGTASAPSSSSRSSSSSGTSADTSPAAVNETPQAAEATSASGDEFVITGKILNAPAQPVFLDKYSLSQGQQNVAKAATGSDGSFVLKGQIKESGLYLIKLNNNVNWLIALDKGEFTFTGNVNDIYKHTMEGSPEATAFSAFVVKAGQNQAALNQINQQFNAARSTGQMQQMIAAQQQYQVKNEEMQTLIRSTMATSEYPLVAIFAASLMNAQENADYLEKFIAKMDKQIPGSPLVSELKQKVDSATKLAIGRVAPDIKLKTPKGETVALSSTRGKVVLLDFWASWCRPCRNENPNVVKLYDKYQAKGFDIFSVSLDQNMDKWVQAINTDNLKWKNHGSTLQGWQCPVAKDYEIQSIPNTLLLDKNGKIIAKNLRGEELAKKLRELFGA